MSDNNQTTKVENKLPIKRKKESPDEDLTDNSETETHNNYSKTINELKAIIENQNEAIEKMKAEIEELLEKQQYEYMPENEILTDNEDMSNDEEYPTSQLQQDLLQEGTINAKVDTFAEQGKKTKPKSAVKRLPPAITTYNVDVRTIIKYVRTAIKTNNFNINVINKNIIRIMPQQSGDHAKIIKYLKEINTKYYTYTPKDKKPFSLIIKKLPLCFEIEDVEEAINALDLNIKVLKIIKTKYNWIIQLENNSDINEFKSIKYLLHCKIRVENVKQTRIMQCKNCQRYNHTAVNCNMTYRCVKCAESHEPGKCMIPKRELNTDLVIITDEKTGEKKNIIGIPVKCVNCGKEGHTANAKICEVRLKLQKAINDKKMPSNLALSNLSTRIENVSYSSLLKKPTHSRNDYKEPNEFLGSLNNDCTEIFGKNFLTCISKLGEFKNTYSMLKTKDAKAKALFTLFVQLKLDE